MAAPRYASRYAVTMGAVAATTLSATNRVSIPGESCLTKAQMSEIAEDIKEIALSIKPDIEHKVLCHPAFDRLHRNLQLVLPQLQGEGRREMGQRLTEDDAHTVRAGLL
eukprot:CAMPEP_0119119836 /NCGR_PEP_ID=MMETSP1310-20130426/1153_1 /TAXON_ID=464262 /ORGANISM="Genus nov. species nov., Strain RCC2339" /LENGTH=108 /DNA_ID=CAMNT_0007109291 /DNA_START=73 /DNA_END=396 /DNA_ORIENTATION=-